MELPPAVKGPQLPFPEPAPLKAPLLDVTLPMPLPTLWLSLFHASSSLLSDFHQQLGDLEVRISPWRRQKGEPSWQAGWLAGRAALACVCLSCVQRAWQAACSVGWGV